VHSLSANSKKMMAVMENITKLVRANKFTLDTVLYKVGEDAISDAFSRAADSSDSAQVVLIFPTLQEERQQSGGDTRYEKPAPAQAKQEEARKTNEEEEREKLKVEWLNLLFTDQSVAATSPEGPLPTTLEVGNKRSPTSLIVWIGDRPKAENAILKDLAPSIGSAAFTSLSWADHPAGEGYVELDLNAPEVLDGSWYQRDRKEFENQDLDSLHDVELLGRSMVEALEPKLSQYGLEWKNVIILGFGKGAGIALYASILNIIPKQVSAMILFSPVVLFPAFMAEKIRRSSKAQMKMFMIWGNKNRSTPGQYRQLLAQSLRKAPEINCTPDTLPDGDNSFDTKCFGVLTSLLPLCLPR